MHWLIAWWLSLIINLVVGILLSIMVTTLITLFSLTMMAFTNAQNEVNGEVCCTENRYGDWKNCKNAAGLYGENSCSSCVAYQCIDWSLGSKWMQYREWMFWNWTGAHNRSLIYDCSTSSSNQEYPSTLAWEVMVMTNLEQANAIALV